MQHRIGCRPNLEEEAFTFNNFLLEARWFTLHQTEGAEYQPTSLPDWNEEKALESLRIERVPFEDLDGNTQGYALRGQKMRSARLRRTPVEPFSMSSATNCSVIAMKPT